MSEPPIKTFLLSSPQLITHRPMSTSLLWWWWRGPGCRWWRWWKIYFWLNHIPAMTRQSAEKKVPFSQINVSLLTFWGWLNGIKIILEIFWVQKRKNNCFSLSRGDWGTLFEARVFYIVVFKPLTGGYPKWLLNTVKIAQKSKEFKNWLKILHFLSVYHFWKGF